MELNGIANIKILIDELDNDTVKNAVNAQLLVLTEYMKDMHRVNEANKNKLKLLGKLTESFSPWHEIRAKVLGQ